MPPEIKPPREPRPQKLPEGAAWNSGPRKKDLHRFDGKREKAKVLNEGVDGKDVVVPFHLRKGKQNDSLAIDVDTKNPQRVEIPDDIRITDPLPPLVLKRSGDTMSAVYRGQEISDLSAEDFKEGPLTFALNDTVGIEVHGFDTDGTVFLHKVQLEKPTDAPEPAPAVDLPHVETMDDLTKVLRAVATPANEEVPPAAADAPDRVDPAANASPAEASKAGQTAGSGETKTVGEKLFGHELPFYRDGGESETPEDIKRIFPKEVKVAGEVVAKAKEMVPQNSGESDYDYSMRVLEEVDKRLRFPGDFKGKEDALFQTITTSLKGRTSGNQNQKEAVRADHVLMAIEASKIDLMREDNEAMKSRSNVDLSRVFRRKTKTVVTHQGEPSFVEGDYERYFRERPAAERAVVDDNGNPVLGKDGKPVIRPAFESAEMPKADLYAFTLVADRLLDITDPVMQVSGESKTYREQMKELEEVLRNPDNKRPENAQLRDDAAERLVALRSHFYTLAIESIRTLDQPRYVNKNPNTQSAKDKVMVQMQERLRAVRSSTIEELVDQYQGVAKGFRENVRKNHKQDMQAVLGDRDMYLLDLALKGADLMQRRISYAPEYHEVPGRIRYKDFVEGPSLRDIAGPGGLTPGPTGGNGENGPGRVPPAPSEGDRREPPKNPGDLTPAPTKEDGEKPPPPKPAPTPRPEVVPTDFTLGAAVLQERRVQNVLQMAEHSFAHDLARMPRPGYANIPVIGGIAWGLRHPVKMIWQQGLLRNVFEQQHIRFASDMIDVAKRTTDQAVPVEVTPDIIERSLEEARRIRGNMPIWNRLVWGASDYAKGLLGVSQTSEQKLARQWFEQQIQQAPAQRDGVLTGVTQRTLVEQDRLGQRFARYDKKSGLTFDQSNRLVLAQNTDNDTRRQFGETRHELPKELQEQANKALKGFIERYAGGTLTEEQLVSEVDRYLLGDFRNGLPANLQQEFTAPEVASNILSIAHKVTGRDETGAVVEQGKWERYQNEKPEGSSQTYWEAVNIDVLFGKGEWGGVRGRKEMGRMTEYLARRLANRETVVVTGAAGVAAALAQDVITYGGAYGAGWLISGSVGATSTLARSVGGVVGVGVMAGLKETGIGWSSRGFRGIKGRYIKEVEQAGREAARGRETPAQARIRQEMQQALVDRVKAVDVLQNLESRVNKAELTPQEAQQLLVDLAALDARMRLTDLSGSRTLNFKQQNYIQFSQGEENAQYDQLKGTLLNGVTRLIRYANENPTFTNGEPFYTGERFAYRGTNQQLGRFEKYSALAEAQLTVSSIDAQMRQWLTRELQMSEGEVDGVMQNIFPNLNLNISREQSLRGKEATLRKLTLKRGVSTAAKTIIASAVAAPAIEAARGEVSDLAGEGWNKYTSDWGKVLRGDVPVDTVDGRPVVDLTPMQRGVLWGGNFWSEEILRRPAGPTTLGQIDGTNVNFPPGLRFDTTNDALVDARNGRIIDLTGMKVVGAENGTLAATAQVDFNRDGVIDSRDDVLATNYLRQRFAEEDIKMSAGPDIIGDGRKEIIAPTGTHEDVAVGHKTVIPNGSEWVKDPASGKWDLVVSKRPDMILINDAKFDSTGKLVDWDHAHSKDTILGITHDGQPERTEQGPPTVIHTEPITKTGAEAAAEFEKFGTKLKGTEWYANNTKVSDINELRLYTHHEGNAVILDMTKMKVGYQVGLHPEKIDVQDVIRSEKAVFAFTLPGHDEKVIVHAPGGQLRLDPTDNDPTHKIKFADGREMQAGLFARAVVNQDALGKLPQGDIATELYNRQDVFKLGLGGKMGFIQAGQLVDHNGPVLQSFATIRGSGGVEFTIPGIDKTIPGEVKIIPGEYLSTIKLTDKLDEITHFRVPTYTLSQTPLRLPDAVLYPLPIRQNIEKSVKEGTVPPAETPNGQTPRRTTTPPGQTAPPPVVPPGTQPPAGETATTTNSPEQQALIQELEELREAQRQRQARGEAISEEEKKRMEELEHALGPLAHQEAQGNGETLTKQLEEVTPPLFEQRVADRLEELRQEYVEMKQNSAKLIPDIEAYYQDIYGEAPLVIYDLTTKKFKVNTRGRVEKEETVNLDTALNLFEVARIEKHIYHDVYHVPPSNDSIIGQSQNQIDARRNELLGNFRIYLEPFVGNPGGYWEHFYGNSDIPGNFNPDGRLYFNPYAAFAPEVMAQMLIAIADRNERGGKKIEVQAKILNRNRLYPQSSIPLNEHHDSLRPDKIVFYFSAEDAEEMFKIAQEVHRKVLQNNPGAPVFSQRKPLLTGQVVDEAGNVLDGVGFAEEPPQIRASYGEIVSAVLANMVKEATGPITPEMIKENIGKNLLASGLSEDAPYLFRQDRGGKFTGQSRAVVERFVKKS